LTLTEAGERLSFIESKGTEWVATTGQQ
jgi:hypothetical protein